MAPSQDTHAEVKHLGPTLSDYLFLVFLAFVVAAVTWLGVLNYEEGIKTEESKANGEAWAAMMTELGTQRFEANNKVTACQGGVKPSAEASKTDAPVAGTWGPCVKYLLEATALKDQINPFFKAAPQLIAACVPTDRTVMGGIVIEDLMPTPPGSAVPFVASQLVDSDPIDYKMQIRVSVCDKGGYAIKISEFEF